MAFSRLKVIDSCSNPAPLLPFTSIPFWIETRVNGVGREHPPAWRIADKAV
jgi:hypothetical protein